MIAYAIRNKLNKKYVYGFVFRYCPTRKRLSENKARLYETLEDVKLDYSLEKRFNHNFYEIVKLSIKCIGVIKDDNN